jgi:hypothetical protein
VDVVLKINGKSICDSKAQYGGTTQSTTGADGQQWQTVSSMVACYNPVEVKVGDIMSLDANYDLATHPPSVTIFLLDID